MPNGCKTSVFKTMLIFVGYYYCFEKKYSEEYPEWWFSEGNHSNYYIEMLLLTKTFIIICMIFFSLHILRPFINSLWPKIVIKHYQLLYRWIFTHAQCRFIQYIIFLQVLVGLFDLNFHSRTLQIYMLHIDGLVQDCSISIANALEIQQSCTKLSILPYTKFLVGCYNLMVTGWKMLALH